MSALGAFNNMLVRFFKELAETFTEERDIKLALETIEGAKKINPRMIVDVFYDCVYVGIHDAIKREDEEFVIQFARKAVSTQFNEISPALLIFDKHWPSMTDANHKVIWNYLKVLCVLCEKARASKIAI